MLEPAEFHSLLNKQDQRLTGGKLVTAALAALSEVPARDAYYE